MSWKILEDPNFVLTKTSGTIFVFWCCPTFPGTDACTQSQTNHIGTLRNHPFECLPRIGRTRRCDRQSLPRRFASRRECRRWHNDASCPFWFLHKLFCRHLRQLHRKPGIWKTLNKLKRWYWGLLSGWISKAIFWLPRWRGVVRIKAIIP